jgi:hypothetical protein
LAIFGRKLTAPIDGGLEPIHHVKDKVSLGFALGFLRRLHHRLNDQQLYPCRDVFISFWVHGFRFIAMLIVGLVRKDLSIFPRTAKRVPYDVVPFILSMFAFVLALNKYGVSANIASWLDGEPMILKYG